MGIVSLDGSRDVPFPNRLFSAMVAVNFADFGENRLLVDLNNRFLWSGSYLGLSELAEDELVAFCSGISHLRKHIEGTSTFVGFDVHRIDVSLSEIEHFMRNKKAIQ